MLKLKLDRPIAFFDIEATGISPRADRMLELCIVRFCPQRGETRYNQRFNPDGMPIPADSTAIHGIRDEDVKDCPTFAQEAQTILDFLEGCDLAGYNILRYDIPMLAEEFGRATLPFSVTTRRILDVQRIFHQKEPRDLTAALQFYCGDAHIDAHGAEADVDATIRVFEGQLIKYEDLPRSIEALDNYCNPQNPTWVDSTGKLRWQDGDVAINFGKNRGKLLRELVQKDRGFINWMLKSDFPPDTRAILEQACQGSYPTKP
ncbi:MAG: exonuclease domain-containing protein [Kiritimatiellia bacterium]